MDMQRGGSADSATINTRHILFIVSGAFSGLEKIVSSGCGRGRDRVRRRAQDLPMDEELFRQVKTQDFIDYGFEAEFIGRLPVRVVCEHLTADDLFEIMKHSEGSLIRQYEREFEAFGIRVQFEDGALREIARGGGETRERGLMTVCERLLRDFKFELPGTSVRELKIDGALVRDPAGTRPATGSRPARSTSTTSRPRPPASPVSFRSTSVPVCRFPPKPSGRWATGRCPRAPGFTICATSSSKTTVSGSSSSGKTKALRPVPTSSSGLARSKTQTATSATWS